MKNIILIAFIGMFGVLTLGSCVRNYNCECVIDHDDSSYDSVVNVPVSGNLNKKDAKKACKNNEKSFYPTDDDDVKCRLKY